MPLGTIARFRVEAAPHATVEWTGAVELERDDTGSVALCPLVEWRVNGAATGLGASARRSFDTPEHRTIGAGPPAREATIEVDAYATVITSPPGAT